MPAPCSAAARQEYTDRGAAGRAGRDVQARYSRRRSTRMVQQLAETRARRTPARPLAICALGGYGRRALCLHSDIDLLIALRGCDRRPSEERFVNALLQPLWDLGLTVGQHVRELAEFAELDVGNAEFLLALLDLRLIAGDERLFQRLRGVDRGAGRGQPAGCCSMRCWSSSTSSDTRRSTTRSTSSSPTSRARRAGCATSPPRGTSGVLQPAALDAEHERAARQLQDAEDFLLRIRSVLHLETGRDVNVLTHELQEKVAETFGCEGRQPQQRVEALMGEYFRHARAVVAGARAGRGARRRRRPGRSVVAPRRPPLRDRRRGRALPRSDPRGVASRRSGSSCSGSRSRTAARVSEQALNCIEQNIERYTADDFIATDGDRQLVRSMLYPRPGLYARLTEMHDCGLLDRVFPEFARIHCRVIRDFYHKYTVDEHTLLAIRGIESLWNPADREPAAVRLDPAGGARAGAADACAALPRRRQVARRRARPGERPARADACSIASSCRRRRAPDRRVPDPQSPADVAGRVPARSRRSARRQAVRRSRSDPRSG